MSLTAGALSASNIGSRSVALASDAATSGTSPYTYQYYRSTTSGFTPGAGNILAGKTALSFTDDTIVPGTQYYYKVVVIDSAGTPASATSAQLSVLAATATPVPNQFEISPTVGMPDLRFNYNTIAAMIDSAYAGAGIAPGTAMKYTQNDVGGVPAITPCTANTDITCGFLSYDVKTRLFVALNRCELAQRGNVIYLIATAPIIRGAQVMIDPVTPGGVVTATTGKPIVGFSQDVATAPGEFVRIELSTPANIVLP